MTTPSDTQSLILSRAATRPGNLALPLPEGLVGAAAKMVVGKMIARGWRLQGGADGVYGPASRDVCLGFQRDKGLVQDGAVGPVTWRASWATPVTP